MEALSVEDMNRFLNFCPKNTYSSHYLKGDIEPVCHNEQGNAYEGFVFLETRSRRTIVRSHVEEYLQNCIKRFNNANQLITN